MLNDDRMLKAWNDGKFNQDAVKNSHIPAVSTCGTRN
jgi:hypothetical protein